MYDNQRQQFYATIANFWADLYGEEYALYDVAPISEQQVDEIRTVTARVGHIFFKMALLLKQVPNETLHYMGFPEPTWQFIRHQTTLPQSVIARLDFIASGDSYKCIELNADTPTFIKELFMVNGEVCRELQFENPNDGLQKQLFEAVRQAVAKSTTQPNPYVVFTAHADNIEDANTVKYLQQAVAGAVFIPLHELQIEKDNGLFDSHGRKIDVLYRQTFPVELIVDEVNEQQEPIGLWLLDLVMQRQLAIINPPSAFLLQNKAVQAVIWGLHEEAHPFFTQQEHDWIQRYFVATYLEEAPFLQQNIPYVQKPIFGREGDTVRIFDGCGQLQHAEQQQSYRHFASVYQQYIEHPQLTFNSVNGQQTGSMLVGSFLVNGQASAFGYRVGARITNNLSYFLPVGIEKS